MKGVLFWEKKRKEKEIRYKCDDKTMTWMSRNHELGCEF